MTVGDLSSMSSGLNWDEAYYSPLSITTRSYFDDNLEKVILGLKVVDQPGQTFKYLSGSTELLAMVITKATGKKLSTYLSESFWKPMGGIELSVLATGQRRAWPGKSVLLYWQQCQRLCPIWQTVHAKWTVEWTTIIRLNLCSQIHHPPFYFESRIRIWMVASQPFRKRDILHARPLGSTGHRYS